MCTRALACSVIGRAVTSEQVSRVCNVTCDGRVHDSEDNADRGWEQNGRKPGSKAPAEAKETLCVVSMPLDGTTFCEWSLEEKMPYPFGCNFLAHGDCGAVNTVMELRMVSDDVPMVAR